MNKELQIIIEILTRKSGPDAAAELAKLRAETAAAGGDTTVLDSTLKKLGETQDKTGKETEKLHVNHRALHAIMNMIGRETAPALGHALTGLLYGSIGGVMALGYGFQFVKESIAKAKEKTQEYLAAIRGFEADATSFTAGQDQINTAMIAGAINADDYKKKIDAIKTAQQSLKEEYDSVVGKIRLEMAELEKLAAAERKAAEAKIHADASSGKITKEQEIIAMAELDGQAAAAKLAREKKARSDEYTARVNELNQTREAAKKAAGETAAAEAQNEHEAAQPIRRKNLLENTKAELEALKKRQVELDKVIKDFKSLPLSDQIPGLHNDWPAYNAAQDETASNKKLKADLEARQKKLSTPEYQRKVEEDAHSAAENLKAKQAAEEQLQRRIKELEAELAAQKSADEIKNRYEPQTTAAETAARNTQTQAEVETERRRVAAEKQREKDEFTRMAGTREGGALVQVANTADAVRAGKKVDATAQASLNELARYLGATDSNMQQMVTLIAGFNDTAENLKRAIADLNARQNNGK